MSCGYGKADRQQEGYDMICMQNDHGPCETPREELRDDALKHYVELSSQCHHWYSVVPRAINFYYDHCDDLKELREYVQVAKAHVQKWSSELSESDTSRYMGAIIAYDVVLSKLDNMECVATAKSAETE